jgi:hypothetical protein
LRCYPTKKDNQGDKLGWFIEYGCYSINISRRNGGGKQNRIINMLSASNKERDDQFREYYETET